MKILSKFFLFSLALAAGTIVWLLFSRNDEAQPPLPWFDEQELGV